MGIICVNYDHEFTSPNANSHLITNDIINNFTHTSLLLFLRRVTWLKLLLINNF